MTATEPVTKRPSPAPFSDRHLHAIHHVIRAETERLDVPDGSEWDLLDPFAGEGTVHQLRLMSAEDRVVLRTVGVEIEPEFAVNDLCTRVGDATALTDDDGTYDVVATSPTFANRLADLYDGSNDRCTVEGCRATSATPDGWIEATPEQIAAGLVVEEVPGLFPAAAIRCATCDGTGRAPSERRTYRIWLGRELSPGSSSGMRWGREYRALHAKAIAEMVRVVRKPDRHRPGGLIIVNVSNSVRTVGSGPTRRRDYPKVVEWWVRTLMAAGCYLDSVQALPTRRYRNGANGDARAAAEHLIVVRPHRPALATDTWVAPEGEPTP